MNIRSGKKNRYVCWYIIFLVLCCSQGKQLYAQNIGGSINIYAQVLDVDTCLNQLLIDNATGFNVGDRVLLIQMKGADVDLTNTASFGTVTDYGDAGNYEFGNIADIKGLQITLTNKIIRLYEAPSGFVQLVRVPQYTDATISSIVSPGIQWNGHKGGIVVMEASGTVTLNADIDVSGMGFRGGMNLINGSGRDTNELDYSYVIFTDSAAEKGEGIVEYDPAYENGRGPLANGGGGGNGHNGGGGGGANGGVGGIGGNQTSKFAPLAVGGLGGKAIDYTTITNRIFFGGGGGAGHQVNAEGTDGAYGGGIVIIRANTLIGGSGKIIANGADAKPAGASGSGGGGGGGTIVLDVNQIKNNPTLRAQGGKGGDNADTLTIPPWCYAPGGGGSGGAIIVKGPSIPPSSVIGGKAGIVTAPALPCYNTTYGASDGAIGGGAWNNVIADENVLFTYPRITKPLDTICAGDFAQLDLPGAHGYVWTPNVGLDNNTIENPKASPPSTTHYTVSYLDNRNCAFQDTVLVIVNPKPNPKIAGVNIVCAGQTFYYKITPFAGATYTWTVTGGSILTGQGTESIGILWGTSASGNIYVDVKATGTECSGIDSMSITISPAIPATISGADTICNGDSVTLTATPGYTKYLWSNGDTLQSIKVTQTGNYFVQTISSGGCMMYSDTVPVLVHPLPVVSITPTAPIMADTGGIDTLTLSAIFATQLWSTGAKTDSLFITDSGTYSVMITDSNGCTATASIYIPRDVHPPSITLSIDTVSGAPCDIITIPIRIDTSYNMPPSGATIYITEITFNQSLLMPMDKTNYVIHGRWGTLTVYGTRPDNQTQGLLQGIRFGVALGDSVATIIKMETFVFSNGKKVRISTYNGLFKLANICTQGGARLFAESDSLLLKQNVPNPAQSSTRITYSLLEEGNSKLWVSDILGRRVATLFDGDIQPGVYSVDLNTSALSEGNYFYILQTPTSVLRRMMRIQR
jgi:hypothetical protein